MIGSGLADSPARDDTAMVHQFPSFAIDEDTRELRVGKREIKVQPRIFDLLAFLATNSARVVTKDELLDSVWPGVIVSESSLQRAVSLARKALAEAGVADAIRTFPRQGYRLVVTKEPADPAVTGRPAVASAMPPPREVNSIAVLAFLDMSPNRDHEYFSDGIAEELLNLLAKIRQLRVIARTSSFSFKGRAVPISEIASRLNVAHVLEGSVRRAGDRVRVTAQLIRASDSAHEWSETYDRRLDDIFAVQDEIAGAVVEQLRIKLIGPPPSAEGTDSAAYELFLQARQAQRRHSIDGYTQALELIAQALAIDSGYAPLWDLRAAILGNQAAKGLVPAEQGYALAREAAEKAVTIDANYAPAHSALGWIAMFGSRDLATAARRYELALALAPADGHILADAAGLLLLLGRIEQAIKVRESVVAVDPANALAHAGLGRAYRCAGRNEEALRAYQRAFDLNPRMLGIRSRIAGVLLELGRPKLALAEVEAESIEELRLIALATIRHALGQHAESSAALDMVIAKHAGSCAYNIARVLALRGEADGAFTWLEKAVRASDPGLSGITSERDFAAVRGDRRWLSLLRRLGMAPRQLDRIPFAVDLVT